MSARNLIFTLLLHSKCKAPFEMCSTIVCLICDRFYFICSQIKLFLWRNVRRTNRTSSSFNTLSEAISVQHRLERRVALRRVQLVDRRLTSEWDFLVAIYVSLLSPTHRPTPASMSSANYAVLPCQEMEVEWKFINRTEQVNSPCWVSVFRFQFLLNKFSGNCLYFHSRTEFVNYSRPAFNLT